MLRLAVLYWVCCIHSEHLSSLSKQPTFSISVIMYKQANNILMPSPDFTVYLDVSFIQMQKQIPLQSGIKELKKYSKMH